MSNEQVASGVAKILAAARSIVARYATKKTTTVLKSDRVALQDGLTAIGDVDVPFIITSTKASATPLPGAPLVTDTLAPSIPTGLAGSVSGSTITWTWDPSMDLYDPSVAPTGVKEYDLELNGATVVVSTTNTSSQTAATFATVGGVSPPPSLNQNGGATTITCAGTGFDGTADQLAFLYWAVSGNFRLTCRVDSFTGVGGFEYAPAGLMVRESTAPGSKYTSVYQWLSAVSKGVQHKKRTVTDGDRVGGAWISGDGTDRWLQIERSGDTFTYRYSADGGSWTDLASETVTMNSSVLIGAFCCDLQASPVVTTAVFQELGYVTAASPSYAQTGVSGSVSARVRARDKASTANVSAWSPSVSATASISGSFTWNPGLYVTRDTSIAWPADAYDGATSGWTNTELDELAVMPAVTGVVQYTTWGKLEGARGDYSAGFAWLDDLLLRCESRGLRLMLMITDSSYGGAYRSTATYPSYLTSESGAAGGVYNKESPYSGVTVKYWNAAVTDRLIARDAAYAARYNTHPWLEGIHLMWETDLGFDYRTGSHGFDQAVYETQLARWWAAAATAWSRKNVWVSANSCQWNMASVIATCYTYGLGVGGPNIYPQTQALDNQYKREPTEADQVMAGKVWNGSAWVAGGTDYRSLLSRACRTESPEWSSWNSNSYGPFSAQQIYDSQYTEHQQSHIFLHYKTNTEGSGPEVYWNSTVNYSPSIKGWLNTVGVTAPIRTTFPARYTALGRTPLTGEGSTL